MNQTGITQQDGFNLNVVSLTLDKPLSTFSVDVDHVKVSGERRP